MKPIRRTIIAILLCFSAAAADLSSWQNLSALQPGQKVEIAGKDPVNAEFVRFDPQGITVRNKKGERTIPQADVSRVSLAKGNRSLWIGLAAGAGGGLIAGTALASRLANESGGDFAGLKPAVIGGCTAVGALIGMAIGVAVRHRTVIYRK